MRIHSALDDIYVFANDDYTFEHLQLPNEQMLRVHHPDAKPTWSSPAGQAGWMAWDKGGTIRGIYVHPDYRRNGLATEMYRRSKEIDPSVHHSDDLTEDGRAWSEKVGTRNFESGERIEDIYALSFMVEADDFGTPPETQPKLPVEEKHDPATCRHCQNNMSPATFEQRKKHNIPPGLTNVHVSNDADSHMVARGTDAQGRVKSFYTPEFEAGQAQKKFNRVKALHEKIPQLDQALSEDSPHNDDAAALLLSRHMGLRPGSTRDTKAKVQAYGASTLEARHAKVDENGRAHLDFIGKEGKHLRFHTSHPDIVNSLQSRLEGKSPRDRLFPDTSDSKMNNYLKNVVGPLNDEGDQPLVKDLRTYHANTTAADEVAKRKTPPKTRQEFLARRKEVATKVSQRLGNTPVMALNSYINPSVFDPWLSDPSWAEARKKARFSMDNDNRDEEVEELVAGMKPEIEKALLTQWLESILWTHNDGSMNVDDPEGDEDSK